MQDNRRSLRHTVEGLAYYRTGHGTFQRGKLIDVSENGIGLVCQEPMGGPPEQVSFRLEGLAPMLFQVRTVWSTEEGGEQRMGLQLLPPAGASCEQKCLHRWLSTRSTASRAIKRGRSRKRKAS